MNLPSTDDMPTQGSFTISVWRATRAMKAGALIAAVEFKRARGVTAVQVRPSVRLFS